MKKISSIFILFVLFLGISACSCKKEEIEPITLTQEQYTDDGRIIYFNSYNKIEEMIQNKKNFAFYVYNNACLGCAKFTPILKEYVEDNNLVIYAITYSPILEENNKSLADKVGGTPSVIIYKDGELYSYISSFSSEHTQYFETIDGFKYWFESYVIIK